MTTAGKASGRVRRSIALRRAIKALGVTPTLTELHAFHLGWICCRTTMEQRMRARQHHNATPRQAKTTRKR